MWQRLSSFQRSKKVFLFTLKSNKHNDNFFKKIVIDCSKLQFISSEDQNIFQILIQQFYVMLESDQDKTFVNFKDEYFRCTRRTQKGYRKLMKKQIHRQEIGVYRQISMRKKTSFSLTYSSGELVLNWFALDFILISLIKESKSNNNTFKISTIRENQTGQIY